MTIDVGAPPALPWDQMPKVWTWGCAALLGSALGACSVLQLGPAGSPTGGPYCFQEPGKPDACYQSEGERAAEQSRRQTELEKEAQRKREAELATHAGEESPQGKFWREQEEAKAVQSAERDRVYEERRRAEDQRKADDAAHAAKVHAMALDKAYAVPAISAIMCSIQDEMAGLKADLAREKRVTAVSGVVNLSARDEAASDLVSAADELAEWRKALKRYGAKELPCKEVAGLWACRQKLETCSEADRGAAEVSMREQATLWGSDKERPQR